MNPIFCELEKYKSLLDEKERLANLTKANNKLLEDQKKTVCEIMVDEECNKISYDGYTYSLKEATKYSKRSDEYLLEKGLDFFGILRSEGLGDLIKENVDARSLNAACRAYVEENGELSEELESVLSVYETMDISKRKG